MTLTPQRIFRRLGLLAFALMLPMAAACSREDTPPVAPGAASTLSSAANGKADLSKPDVFILILDAMRAESMSVYGHGMPTTPYLEELAPSSVVFERCTTQGHWTRVALPSLATGLFPTHHGQFIKPKGPEGFHDSLAESAWTLADAFVWAGYRTLVSSPSPWYEPVYGLDQGFQLILGPTEITKARGITRQAAEQEVTGLRMQREDKVAYELALEEFAAAKAEGVAFMAQVHVNGPHGPFNLEDEYIDDWSDREAYARYTEKYGSDFGYSRGEQRQFMLDDAEFAQFTAKLYLGRIRATDDMLREFIPKALAINPNTLFVITSDHGQQFLENGRETFHGSTGSPYDELLRIPMVCYWPGKTGGQRVSTRVAWVDVFPSLAELLKLKPAEGMDGASFAGFLQPGLSRPAEDRLIVSAEAMDFFIVSAMRDHLKFIRRFPSTLVSLYQMTQTEGSESLFDQAADRYEETNLVFTQPGAAAALALDLHRLLLHNQGLHVVVTGDGDLRDMALELQCPEPVRLNKRFWNPDGFDHARYRAPERNLIPESHRAAFEIAPGSSTVFNLTIPDFPMPLRDRIGAVSVGFVAAGAAGDGLGVLVESSTLPVNNAIGIPESGVRFHREYLAQTGASFRLTLRNESATTPVAIRDLFASPTQGSLNEIAYIDNAVRVQTALATSWVDVCAGFASLEGTLALKPPAADFPVYAWSGEDFTLRETNNAGLIALDAADLVVPPVVNIEAAIRTNAAGRSAIFVYRAQRVGEGGSAAMTPEHLQRLRDLGYLK